MEALENPTLIGAIIILVYGIVEIAKAKTGAHRREQNGSNGSVGFHKVDQERLEKMGDAIAKIETETHQLAEAHARFDKDGLPLWYVPREWGEAQKELLKEVQETNRILAQMLELKARV